MSWQAMKAVDDLPYHACGPLAYRFLVKLANVADQNGTRAWRFVPEVASELGVSERSVHRARKELEDAGLIRKGDQRHVTAWRGGNRPVVYDLNMRALETLPVLEGLSEEAYEEDLAGRQCPHNNGKAHRFDPTYHFCSCGVHDPAVVGT